MTKQFSRPAKIIKAPTKTRFEVGINLKGQEPKGKLEAEKPNALYLHKIILAGPGDIDKEVMEWIRKAYDNAGYECHESLLFFVKHI